MNTAERDPEPERVRETFQFEPETGVFVRIKSLKRHSRYMVGQRSGSLNKATGYIEMYVEGVKHYAHRLAWLYANGPIPDGFYVDHINGIRSDNRLANLRLARHRENMHNCKVRSDNTSGVKGVSFDKSRGQWAASIAKRHLGRFATLEEAAAARKAAAEAAYGAFARE